MVAITQLINGALGDGAHPTTYIGTVVIDSRTAKPITLADLFSDEQAGLQRLSEQTKLEPVETSFADWIPTADGIEIHRLPQTLTVPWSALNDVLAPGMAGLGRALGSYGGAACAHRRRRPGRPVGLPVLRGRLRPAGLRQGRRRSPRSRATPTRPISRGRLCPKGAATKPLVTGPQREHRVKYRRPARDASGRSSPSTRRWT